MQQWQLDKRSVARARLLQSHATKPKYGKWTDSEARKQRHELESLPRHSRSSEEGRAAQLRGARNEKRLLLTVLDLRDVHVWILDARLADREEDSRGIDIVITTSDGEIYLQSKSHPKGAKAWRFKYHALNQTRIIDCIVVPRDDKTLRERAFGVLRKLRERQLDARKAHPNGGGAMHPR